MYGSGSFEYEFASSVLAKVKEPKDVLEPRFRLALSSVMHLAYPWFLCSSQGWKSLDDLELEGEACDG